MPYESAVNLFPFRNVSDPQAPGHIETPATPRAWLSMVIALWMATAVLTGFLHGAELLVEHYGFGRLAWFSREFAWMAPVAYALVMLPGAVFLLLLGLLARRRWMLPFAAGAFATVGAFGLLLPYSQLSRMSSLILSLGIAVSIARAVHRHPAWWIRKARVIAAAGIAAIVVIVPVQRLARVVLESRAVASLPAAPAAATNVLIIILDTVRAASMGLYGAPEANTPRLDEWSRSGTVFEWAFSPAPWTLPSHGSMLTGAWAGGQSGNWETPLDDKLPTLAERFRDRGYLTGGFVANMHYTAWDSGLPRGFARYDDYQVNWGQLVRSTSYTQTGLYRDLRNSRDMGDVLAALRHPNLSIDPKHNFELKHGEEVADEFLDWQARSAGRPFFAFLNLFDGHQPYYAPPEFLRFKGEGQYATYLAAVAYLDAQVDRILATLRERGALDRTLVVVTSDHGELFGFKQLYGHAHNLYLNTIRVPLLLRLPGGVPAGLRVQQPVTLRDLAATVMQLAAPGEPAMPGTSLAAAWTGGPPLSPVVSEVTKARNIASFYPTARGDMQTLLDDQWQLIRNGDGRLELYAYRADTLQEQDLVGDPGSASRLDSLQRRLTGLLRDRR